MISDAQQSRRAAQAELVTRMFILFLVAALIASLATIVILLGQVRDTQLDGTPTGKKLLASADRILDCTEPGSDTAPAGDCYERGQQQTAGILASAQQIILLSAVCAVDLDPADPFQVRLQQITSCVTNGLTEQPRKP